MLRRATVVSALLTVSCTQPAFGPEDEAAVRAVLDAQQAAWNGGDLDMFMQGYHRDDRILFTSGAKIRQGWDATLHSYRDRYDSGEAKMGVLDFRDVTVTGLGPDAALVFGHFELTDTPQASQGVFSLVFEQRDGTWAIIHDHSSVPAKDCPSS